MRDEVPNSFDAGDIVYAIVNPTQKLVVRRYCDRIYYCKIQDDPKKKDLVYFERELIKNVKPMHK